MSAVPPEAVVIAANSRAGHAPELHLNSGAGH